jgi:hypothetical protein
MTTFLDPYLVFSAVILTEGKREDGKEIPWNVELRARNAAAFVYNLKFGLKDTSVGAPTGIVTPTISDPYLRMNGKL